MRRSEAVWLEAGEAARLLKAARRADAAPHPRTVPYLEPLLATFLLTGGRRSEVFGLQVRDIDLKNQAVHFRPNEWRRLKRPQHRRWVPLWPQLHELLREYMERFERTEGLLFVSPSAGPLSDVRGSIATLAEQAKIEKRVTHHTFRHTYAATRLQTLDHGQPVSPYTVMRELGHSSLSLIERTYGHLMQTRHRSPVVEYREAKLVDISEARGG